MDPFNPQNPNNQAGEALKKEMERVARDTVMVHNPTDEDYRIEWDGFYHIVPSNKKDIGFGKGNRELERFLAINYVTHMKDQLINQMAERKGKELLAKRKEEGKPDYLDVYAENKEVWDKVPRTSDPKLMETIFNDLWLGVVRAYGADAEEDEEKYGDGRIDTRTVEEKLLEKMNKAYVPPKEIVDEPTPVTPAAKKKLMDEVAA